MNHRGRGHLCLVTCATRCLRGWKNAAKFLDLFRSERVGLLAFVWKAVSFHVNEARLSRVERALAVLNRTAIQADQLNRDDVVVITPLPEIDAIGQRIFQNEEYRSDIPAWRYFRKLNAFANHSSPSLPMASTGHPSRASMHSATSSSVLGWACTNE